MKNLRLWGISTLVIMGMLCGTLFLQVQNGFAATIELREMQVTYTSATETTPTLGADNVSRVAVYTSYKVIYGQVQPADVFAQRLDAESPVWGPVLVSGGNTDNRLNDISGNRIVYTAFQNFSAGLGWIKLFDLTTGATATITQLGYVFEAVIHGNKVAWVSGNGTDTTIMYFDMNTGGAPVQISSGAYPSRNVQIGDTFVVWQEKIDGDWDIVAYDTRTGTLMDISAEVGVADTKPTTSGSWVVWQQQGGVVKAKNMDNGQVITITDDNLAYNPMPTIDGDYIAYEGNSSGNKDIFLYEISTGRTFQLTSDPADQYLNNIHGNQVAYVDYRNGDSDVFVTTFYFDTDEDGILDFNDNCINTYNPDQADNERDGDGDACDPDDDNDTVLDPSDNCQFDSNSDQADNEPDGTGDICDPDDDNDGILDGDDNCQFVSSADQSDIDGDGLGDSCDEDPDGDGLIIDNCPMTPNPYQEDNEGDGDGDACDPDDDNDGIDDTDDNCPLTVNVGQDDLDGDNIGDLCDIDIDGDDIDNDIDNCPFIANVGQDDTDGDDTGNACDEDDDNDGVLDNDDNCQLQYNPGQDDSDADGKGDICDGDRDGDGIDDDIDNCPDIANSNQNDWDEDGIGDSCDPDIDNDGVPNDQDECNFSPMDEIDYLMSGCTIDELVPCSGPKGTTEPWKNHGKYMSTLAKTLNSFLAQGLITEEEKGATMASAGDSGCGK